MEGTRTNTRKREKYRFQNINYISLRIELLRVSFEIETAIEYLVIFAMKFAHAKERTPLVEVRRHRR